MKNRMTRPQLRREYAYLKLRVRTAGLAFLDTLSQQRHNVVLAVGAAVFLGLMGFALAEIQSGQSTVVANQTVSPSVNAPVATQRPPVAGPPNPPTRPESQPGPQPQPQKHVVTRGETLASIAVRDGVPLEQIAADNRLRPPYHLAIRQRLLITRPPDGVTVIAPDTSLSQYAQRLGLSVERLRTLNPHITDPDRIIAGSGLRIR